ncbi:MAG: nucleoside hydrolase [Ilumatobacteraceae bacterium]
MPDAVTPDRSTSTPPRVVLDCDPGHDDAMAIIAAAAYADLVGITTVAGNAPLERTTHNARVMRDLMGLDVPIHSGSPRPLIAEPSFGAFVHGESGLDGADLPAPTTALDGVDAVSFIIESCRSIDDLWLVPVGPLTNIALALRAAPDIAQRIAGISLMGGGTFGNRVPSAEFNIWADPEAAAIVFGYGGRLIMAGLDVTHRFQATPERIDRIAGLDGVLADVLADLLGFFSANYISRHDAGALRGAAVHDPLAVFAITHPTAFDRVDRHVVVETRGEHTRGMTVIDQRTILDRRAANAEVLVDVDDDAVFDLLIDAIARYSSPHFPTVWS